MSEQTGAPNDPQDKLKFINSITKQTEELLRSTFSPQEYVKSIYSLVAMENDFDVTITESSLKAESVHKGTEEMLWQKLQKVSIVTNDKGPFTADVFMVFFSDTGACTVPQGNSEYNDLYTKVTAFKNVNFENIIKAMSSSGNAEFVIWEGKPAADTTSLCYALFHCDPASQPPFTLELGFSDKSVRELKDCANIPSAVDRLEEICKKENISKSAPFTLLYPIYMEAMNSDNESTMHNIAWLIKEQADKNKWNFDRISGLTGRKPADFIL
jgi:hypothetical protein